jgi:mannan endo-1,4-beta-mannosidase
MMTGSRLVTTVVALIIATGITVGLSLQASANSPQGFVSACGTQLCLGGAPYVFTGFNIYNANSDGSGSSKGCSYAMSAGGALDASLSDMPGDKVFRAWFFQGFAITNGARDWSAFDHTLAVAHAHGFRVIVTLANQWGACDSSLGYKSLTWYQGGYSTQIDPGYLTPYRQWVADVVNRYKDDQDILLWQLVNEAEDQDVTGSCQESAGAAALHSFADTVGGLVHRIDPNHLVNLGTIGSGQCGTQGNDYETVYASPGNDVCEYHDYNHTTSPMPGDAFNGLQTRIDQCRTLGKPIFVGETGINAQAAGGYSQRASLFGDKFSAQFGAGVVGELIWSWHLTGARYDSYEVGPGDPVLALGALDTGGFAVSTSSLPSGTPRVSYSGRLVASGGHAPYKWSVSLGSLPRGLHLKSTTGTIFGKPSKVDRGTYLFTVKVVDKTKVRHQPTVQIVAKKVLSITIL